MAKKIKSAIWMPLYVGDYLADTMHLNAEQHGAYLLLIMAAFKNGGSIPNDEEHLQTLSRMTPDQWVKSSKTLQKFFSVGRDFWVHERVKEEFDKSMALIAIKSKAGHEGAKNRWAKKRLSEEESVAIANNLIQEFKRC